MKTRVYRSTSIYSRYTSSTTLAVFQTHCRAQGQLATSRDTPSTTSKDMDVNKFANTQVRPLVFKPGGELILPKIRFPPPLNFRLKFINKEKIGVRAASGEMSSIWVGPWSPTPVQVFSAPVQRGILAMYLANTWICALWSPEQNKKTNYFDVIS